MKYTHGIEAQFEKIRDGYVDRAVERGSKVIAAEYLEVTDGQLTAAQHGAVQVLTPTLDFIKAVNEESHSLGDFLEYLRERFIIIDKCRTRCSDEMEIIAAIGAGDFIETEKILADYYGIDLEEAEREKTELLEAVRNGCTHGEYGK